MIVTGASSGIGRELVRAAARDDFAVLAVARRAERLRELESELGTTSCAILPLDIRSPGAPQRIVQTALARYGRIDVVVNNAGMASAGPLLEQSDAALDAQWTLHVSVPLRITREALPELLRRRGQVIFIGSGVARVPLPNYGAYSAAKAAVRAAATQLRRELRGTGIAITYVDPGSVETEFAGASGLEDVAPRWLLAQPDRVARRIMRAVGKRPATFHAVPFQAIGTALGEMFPRLADRAMGSIVAKPKAPQAEGLTQAEALPQSETAEVNAQETDFDRALAPMARRLERIKLPSSFLATLLRSGDRIELGDAAMRWAGMPNKNERAAMGEALQALSDAGFLRPIDSETWEVVRSPIEGSHPA